MKLKKFIIQFNNNNMNFIFLEIQKNYYINFDFQDYLTKKRLKEILNQ